MRKLQLATLFLVFLLTPIISIHLCSASPSSNFYEEVDDMYDDWCVSRTRCWGADGYFGAEESETSETGFRIRPLIAFESLGQYTDVAYNMGQQFLDNYPDREQRAEQLFEYVRDTVTYMHDIDQFGTPEYAVNADELARIIQEEGTAFGDCEDFAFLLAVMYQGAGFRSAVVLCPGHAAVLVYLPGYDKANVVLDVDGEPGWVWAEGTGKTNRFGWFPQGWIEEPILTYELSSDAHIDYCRSPAKFTLADLTASPSPATVDDTVVISATVENVGEQSGDCVVSLSVGGYTDSNSISSLGGGTSSDVSFTYAAKTTGTYRVTVSTADTMATTRLVVEVEGEERPSGGGCFIATAAYNTPMAQEIEVLREFRDECLLSNPMGQALVNLYYTVSPPVADFISEHPSLKPIVRAELWPAVAMSTIAVNASPVEKIAIVDLLALVSVLVPLWVVKRRSGGSQHPQP